MGGESLAKVSFLVNHPPCRPQVDDVTVMMHVVGSIKELGSWDPVHSKRMRRGNDGMWEVTLYMPKGNDVKYQYVLKDFDEKVVWQGQRTRTRRVDGFSALQQLQDQILPEEGAEPRDTVRTPRGMHISSEALLGKLVEPSDAPARASQEVERSAPQRYVPNRHRQVDAGNKGCVPIARPTQASGAADSVALPTSVTDMMSRSLEQPLVLAPPLEQRSKKVLEAVGEVDETTLSVGTPKPMAPPAAGASPETPPTLERLAVSASSGKKLPASFWSSESKEGKKESSAEDAVREALREAEEQTKKEAAPSSASSAASSTAKAKKKHRRSARASDMRSSFMRFLEREAERKRDSLTSLKRRTCGANDSAEREKLESSCSSLSQELDDLDDLLLDTREAVVFEAMERLEDQKLWRQQRAAAKAAPASASVPAATTRARGGSMHLDSARPGAVQVQVPSPEPARSESASPPPPLHHRGVPAAPPAPPQTRPSYAGAPQHARARSVPAASQGPRQSTDSGAEGSARSSLAHYPPRNRLVRAREAYCNTVSRRIAKPVVGPVDRMLGRMSRWVYGDPQEACRRQQQQQQQQRATEGAEGCGAGYGGLLKMCCTVDHEVLRDLSKTSAYIGELELQMLRAAADAAQRQQAAAPLPAGGSVPHFYEVQTPATVSRSAIVV